MKNTDELLRRHRVMPRRQLSSDFTNNVLDGIEREPQRHRVWRGAQEFYARMRQLPRLAFIAIAIAIAGTGSTAVYAAYSWLAPKITVLSVVSNSDDKREFLMNVQDCGVVVGGETADNGKQRYEVSKDSNLSDDQVVAVIQNSCKFQQLLNIGQNHWHDDSEIGAGAINVYNDPPLGTVTAIDAQHITLTSKVYQEYDGPSAFSPDQPIPDINTLIKHFPNGKELTRTFSIAGNADLLVQGQAVPLSNLHVGDKVFFKSTAGDPTKPRDMHGLPSTLVHFVKTDIDPDYVQPMALGNPSIINAVARLGACLGNHDYLCVNGNKEGMNVPFIYATDVTELPANVLQTFKGNEKYFRKDIDPVKVTSNEIYHIEGRITKLDGTHVELRPRGKTQIFSVSLPYDAVKAFNQSQSQKLGLGDYVQADYIQQPSEDHTVIKSGDLTGFALVLRQVGDGSFVKY